MKNKIKKISLVSTILGASIFVTSCAPVSSELEMVKTVKSFIKGVDISSYVNVTSNFLNEQNIKKDDKSSYSYKEYETENITINNTQQTIQDYIDNNLYSYIDDNGNRKYQNFFKILKDQGDVNSIRLRLWNDPYDENKKSYMGELEGVNDLDTDIYIMKQAIKEGINHFNLDFHYSDFWADPGHQINPKAWDGLDTEGIKKAIKDFTYNSLVKIYQETGVLPAQVQIGNEITKGFVWGNDDSKFESDYLKPDVSIKYLRSAIEAVNEAQEYINKTYNKNTNIKIAVHLESLSSQTSKKAISTFLNDQFIDENLDIVGVTYYPFWSLNLEKFRQDFSSFWTKLGKEIIFEEYSTPYTSDNTGYTGDLDYKTNSNSIPTTSSGQVVMLNAFLNLISQLTPDKETGFYYWEPGWLYKGKQTWASQSGINYITNSDKSLDWKYGYNWSNQGLFDRNGIMLPSLKVLKNFERNPIDYYQFNFFSWVISDLVNPIKNDWGAYNDQLLKQIDLFWNKNTKKSEINKELFKDYDGSFSNHIDYFTSDLSKELSNDEIMLLVKKTYKRIMWNDLTISNISYDSINNSYKVEIDTNNSFYYFGIANIVINIKDYWSKSVDLSNEEISIEKSDTNWASKIFEFINSQDNKNSFNLDQTIWKYFNLKGGISNQDFSSGLWLYDEINSKNRYSNWAILKTDKIYVNENSTEISKLNNEKYEWPNDGLKDIFNNNNTNDNLYFAIDLKLAAGNEKEKNDTGNSVTYLDVGKESWQYPKILVFKLNVKWS
ncbi:hypothetical protein D8X55_03710 [Malacoplasma penetrans]|uniref:Arabinogalactan endo-beta-1,4-galactanase n=1 Tax=Malacoplasma penetrans (strain HF-2) TaxID=272633 RepID=Q8EVD3_MALP2|nr:glycosyl hydrolase 53 family protein [Malacoplasma penetrans]RXY96420.1 hypothetical protein D8X55_03710 [Malacoplasma penetrans]BAC44423.1 conserved hypothetical protein [Malacoplasma penetrans HF-2]